MYINEIYVKVLLIFEIYWDGGRLMMDRQAKLTIISEGQKYGVTRTCEKHDISRTLYYRWLKKYESLGMEGLDSGRRTSVPVNRAPDEVTERVVTLIRSYPSFGPREIKYLLEEIGHDISESCVYNIMKRLDLSTKEKRVKFSRKKLPSPLGDTPDFQTSGCGECWFFWITVYGGLKESEKTYAYTIFDYKSRVACSRIYEELSMDCFEDLLTAAALPVAQSLGFNTRYLCFLEDGSLPCRNRSAFLGSVHKILQSSGFDPMVYFLKSEELSTEIDQLKKEYALHALACIIPHLHKELPFSEIRLILQRSIRSYNLRHRTYYGEILASPLEYHSKATGSSMILPLWAYIDREY